MKYKAVLFDFDYTLGDATESIVAGYAYGLTQLGWPEPSKEAVQKTIGYLLEDGYTMLTGDTDVAHKKQFKALFREKAHPIQVKTTTLFPGALQLMKALQQACVPTAVVSTKHSATLHAVLEHTGIMPYLAFAIGSDDVSKPKPDPEGITAALHRLHIEPQNALYCGDTVLDAEAANRANCGFCAVLNGTTPEAAFAAWPHSHICPDLPSLQAWLGL